MILKQSYDSSPILTCLAERVSDIPANHRGCQAHVPGSEDTPPWQSASGPTHRWVRLNASIWLLSGLSHCGTWAPEPALQEPTLQQREAVRHAAGGQGSRQTSGWRVVDLGLEKQSGDRPGKKPECRKALGKEQSDS